MQKKKYIIALIVLAIDSSEWFHLGLLHLLGYGVLKAAIMFGHLGLLHILRYGVLKAPIMFGEINLTSIFKFSSLCRWTDEAMAYILPISLGWHTYCPFACS